mmetsp:Transcript_8646/g.29496  ORF Transcript_8646/g.29496 Transcript_8646/m.29496 type:complete len:153 (-) Transcript_8646:53-511(-)
MAASIFCAVPPGRDGGWGGRYAAALAYGCIPVFVQPRPHAKPLGGGGVDWQVASVTADTPELMAALPSTLAALVKNRTWMARARQEMAVAYRRVTYGSIFHVHTCAPTMLNGGADARRPLWPMEEDDAIAAIMRALASRSMRLDCVVHEYYH